MIKQLVFLLFIILSVANGEQFLNGNFIQQNEPSDFIIGGNDAKDGQVPYIVSLQRLGVGHFCAGAIIDAKWILTAAHCVERYFVFFQI